MAEEIALCGNNTAGITQSTNGTLHLYAGDMKVLSVEPALLKIYARISRVKGSNAASANALTLPLNGTLFHITGTTNIQYITTTGWSEGSAIVLIFKGALDVQNNVADPPADTARILLNGASNFTVQENSTLSLVYDGEYWFETGRKV